MPKSSDSDITTVLFLTVAPFTTLHTDTFVVPSAFVQHPDIAYVFSITTSLPDFCTLPMIEPIQFTFGAVIVPALTESLILIADLPQSVPIKPPRNTPPSSLSLDTVPVFKQFVISILPCIATPARPPAYLATSPVKTTEPSNQQLLIVDVVYVPSTFIPLARPTSPPTCIATLFTVALLYTVSISPRRSPTTLPI